MEKKTKYDIQNNLLNLLFTNYYKNEKETDTKHLSEVSEIAGAAIFENMELLKELS